MSKHFNDEYPAHSGVGVSKEQTPMEELLSIVEELKSKGQEVDTNGLEDWINSVGLGKEKQYAQTKVLEALEREDVKIYTGLRDLNGDRIYRGDVVQNEVEERGVIMYWDGAFCVAYFEEPAKEYLHTLTITDKNYCSTGKVKLTKITKQK
jgi:hypothetical protein